MMLAIQSSFQGKQGIGKRKKKEESERECEREKAHIRHKRAIESRSCAGDLSIIELRTKSLM